VEPERIGTKKSYKQSTALENERSAEREAGRSVKLSANEDR